MIVNRLELNHNIVTVTPEEPEDLWTLRRIISKGDLVKSETSRVVKETAEYSRPDKERVKVVITVEAEQVKLDASISRLRVSGRIMDVSNELMDKGSFHSLSITLGRRISIKKPSGFSEFHLKLVHGATKSADSYLIVAIDAREAAIGKVSGTHLEILPVIESGSSGKMYRQTSKPTSNYYERIASTISDIYRDGIEIFVLGPGTVKNAFANYLKANNKDLKSVNVIEGSDVAGYDGVYVAMRTPNLQDALSKTRLSKVSKILQEVLRRIGTGDSRVALAFQENLEAAQRGAVESVIISENIFSNQDIDEDSIVTLLNKVEESKGESFLLDSSTDSGKQVDSLGGIVGLLRYSILAR